MNIYILIAAKRYCLMLVNEGGNTILQEILDCECSDETVKSICQAIFKMVEQERNHTSSENLSTVLDMVSRSYTWRKWHRYRVFCSSKYRSLFYKSDSFLLCCIGREMIGELSSMKEGKMSRMLLSYIINLNLLVITISLSSSPSMWLCWKSVFLLGIPFCS